MFMVWNGSGLGGLGVGGVVTGILGVGVFLAAFGNMSARVLPDLALVVPMKAKLRQSPRNLGRLLLREGNPNPLADNFGECVETGGFGAEPGQDSIGA